MSATVHIFDEEAFLIDVNGRVVNVTGNVGNIRGATFVDYKQHPNRGRQHIVESREAWEALVAARKAVATGD